MTSGLLFMTILLFVNKYTPNILEMEEEAEIFVSRGHSHLLKAKAETSHALDTEFLTATTHALIILASLISCIRSGALYFIFSFLYFTLLFSL